MGHACTLDAGAPNSLLCLTLASDVLLPTLWLKHKGMLAHQYQRLHINTVKRACPNAGTVLGHPVMDHLFLSIDIQAIVPTNVLLQLVLIGHKPFVNSVLPHGVGEELFPVTVGPRPECERRFACRRPGLKPWCHFLQVVNRAHNVNLGGSPPSSVRVLAHKVDAGDVQGVWQATKPAVLQLLSAVSAPQQTNKCKQQTHINPHAPTVYQW